MLVTTETYVVLTGSLRTRRGSAPILHSIGGRKYLLGTSLYVLQSYVLTTHSSILSNVRRISHLLFRKRGYVIHSCVIPILRTFVVHV